MAVAFRGAIPFAEPPASSEAEGHVGNLFSEDPKIRDNARRWLERHADPEMIARIGEAALQKGPLYNGVRQDVHTLLRSYSLRHMGTEEFIRLPAEKTTKLTLALSLTMPSKIMARQNPH